MESLEHHRQQLTAKQRQLEQVTSGTADQGMNGAFMYSTVTYAVTNTSYDPFIFDSWHDICAG